MCWQEKIIIWRQSYVIIIHYIFLISIAFNQVECLVEFPPVYKMLFNTTLVSSSHYFIYLKQCLWWNSGFNNLVIVKLAFHMTILHLCQCIIFTSRNICWYLFLALANFSFFCVNLTKSHTLNFKRPWGILAQRLLSLSDGVNVER